jgi:hypothetical protein
VVIGITYRARPRRGEKQRLPGLRRFGQDLPYLRLETHVQHAVGFVQHEVRSTTKVQRALFQKVVQAPGRRDADLRAV